MKILELLFDWFQRYLRIFYYFLIALSAKILIFRILDLNELNNNNVQSNNAFIVFFLICLMWLEINFLYKLNTRYKSIGNKNEKYFSITTDFLIYFIGNLVLYR